MKRKKTPTKKEMTMLEYTQRLDEIIAQGKPVAETLADLLEEASKIKIKK